MFCKLMFVACILAVAAAKPSGILAPVIPAVDAEVVDTYQTSPLLHVSSYSSAPSSAVVLPAATSYASTYQQVHHLRTPLVQTYAAPVPVVRTVYHQSAPLVHHTISSPTFVL